MNIGGSSASIRQGTFADDFSLTCNVTVVEYLTVEPTVEWKEGRVGIGNGGIVGGTTHSGVRSIKTLKFSPLCPSHHGVHICEATINIPHIKEITAKAFADVRVDSPSE